jgi:hypothetical protein
MNNTNKEIARLSAQGYCCSQIMLIMGLDAMEDENPQLVDAVSGLCRGLQSGLACGTLSGAACLLALFDKAAANTDMIPRLVEWFKERYTGAYGGITCDEIVCGDPMNKCERCPKIMAETYEQCRELLHEHGYEIQQ